MKYFKKHRYKIIQLKFFREMNAKLLVNKTVHLENYREFENPVK